MANDKNFKRRVRKLRQEWNPHWLLKLAYAAVSAALSLLKIVVGAAATVLLIVLICGTVFVGTLGDYLQEDILTDASDWSLEDYDLERTSFIYYVDNNGDIQQLQQIYTTTDRQWASLDEIPQALVDAAVAIEDKRFYEHQGVDWITTVKACLNMFFGGDEQFGGSTITQQFIKNHTGEKSVTVQRKVMEIFRAQLFEREYDKDLIMEYYLNEIYLGRGCYGVKSAAAEYFGKELQNLTVAECASLISITNNPSLFNPYSISVFEYKGEERDGAGRNRYRQLNVLSEMHQQGYLTDEEYEEAVAQEMVFKEGIADEDRWTVCENPECGFEGIRSQFTGEDGAYYCPVCGNLTSVSTNASQHIYSWFVDAVIIDFASYLAEQDGKNWDDLEETTRNVYLERIQKGGYHIYTTLDMDVQKQVDAIYGNLDNIPGTNSNQQLQSAIVVIDNTTGDVVALAGGVGEKDTFMGYNRATQAKLQTGSAQKPVSVYAPAFESGKVTPATVFKDLPVTYDGGNWPKNDNRQYQYARTVYQGIVSSVNTISVRTLNEIGAEYGYSFAKYNFGQAHLVEEYPGADGTTKSDVGPAPLALGALTVGSTVQEMSAAYATFANHGVYREPRLYTKVYNSDGQLVVDNTQDSRQILSEKTVDYVNYCLYNAANHGTGGAAIFGGQSIAGKTGTTSSNRDRWFCGYTTHYTAAVWVGYDQPEQIHLGTNPAAQMWKKVMQPIHEGLPNEALYNGNAFRTVAVCLDSGLLATDACRSDVRGIDRVVYVNVYPGDEPQGTCDKHVQMEYCISGGGVATEYCSMFPDANVAARSLVKLNSGEVDEIRSAIGVGLNGVYASDGYVYYQDGSWHGFSGNYGSNDQPYLVCPIHNENSWLEHEENQPPEEGGEDISGGNPDDNYWEGEYDG
ncbi:MAG TPA: transglycosylase domain-containing protein [Candidatus Faecousia faecavium]|nr:transglycosylase domain-containing protein [Candidatus Faecousia faecavium]